MVFNMDENERIDAHKKFEKIEGFIKDNNYKLINLDKNYVLMEAKLTPSSMNPHGMGHGGFILGLADTACGVAAVIDGLKGITVDGSINYFHPAKGEYIRVEAKALKVGKNISTYQASIYDDQGTLIAFSIFTTI